MRKVSLAEAGKAGKAQRGVERVKQPQMQGQAQWTDHPKRIDVGSATQARQMVGAKMIAHTNLLTPSWVPREDATTDTYIGCTVSGRHPARHLHHTDVLRE